MISFYCSEKLDGVATAAIILRHATLSKLPAHFGGFLHPDTLSEELTEIAKETHKLIFLLDVSLLPEHLSIIDSMLLDNKLLYWNTHDPTSVVPCAKFFDGAVPNKCSAELACTRFLPHDQVAKQLAQLAHEVKFWQLKDERATKLSDILVFGYPAAELIETLARGVFWNDRFEAYHSAHSQKKIVALEELMRSLVVKNYLSYRFGFALASQILSSADACARILEGHAGVDIAVVLYKDGRVAFRRRDDCLLDVRSLAELFSGGGHPFASGARLNMTITKDSFVDALFALDSSLRKFFVGIPPSPGMN